MERHNAGITLIPLEELRAGTLMETFYNGLY